MKHDIFISYKSQDIAVTKAIAHIMESEDIICWYAPRNLDNQAAGKDYDDKIVEAIKACKIVIVLLSDESLESEWVKFEVACAQRNKKFIIPYVIRELTIDNGLLNRLTNKHWIDAYPNPEKKFNILLNNVKLAMSQLIGSDKDSEDLRKFKIDVIQDFENDFDYEEGEVLYEANETVDAVRAFLTSAENGNPKAKKILCEIFYNLENKIQVIPNDLWEIIDRQAKLGHCYANFLMHAKYYKVNESEFISFEYLKKAIKDSSIPEAFLRLGIQYGWGLGVKQSHTLEMHYYNKAASMGFGTAYSYIGQIYGNGNDKFERNLELAISNYEKGVAENNRRALMMLCQLYFTEETHMDLEKAKSLAQKAIDCGYDEGYVWMGDIYYWTLEESQIGDINNCKEAQKWYKTAATKEVKSAYSSLANMYWNAGENEMAFRWAHNGVMHNDSGSYQALGWFYEHEDGQYDEAWKYYLKYYDNFGSGAENLARLYIDYEYRPSEEDYNIKNLVAALEVCAKNSDKICIDYLISLHTKYADALELENPQQKIMEYERLGAELGFSEYMHTFGLRFFNKEDKQNYNPYRGMQWIEKSAQKMYKDSVLKLIEISGREGIEPDSSIHEKWCDFALVNGLALMAGDTFLNHIKGCASYKPQYSDYLIKRIEYETDAKVKAEIYKMIITGSRTEERRLSDAKYESLLNDVKKEQDAVLNVVYGDIKSDPSFEEVCAKGIDVFKEKYWSDILTDQYEYSIFKTYKDICMEQELKMIDTHPIEAKNLYPAISSKTALSLKSWCLAGMVDLIKSGIAPFNEIAITDTHEHILNIAEKEKDETIQCYLVSYVETIFEIDEIISNNHNIWYSYITNKYEDIVSALELYKNRLNDEGIKHNLPEFNEDYVKELIEKNPIDKLRENLKSNTITEDEDFNHIQEKFLEEDKNQE